MANPLSPITQTIVPSVLDDRDDLFTLFTELVDLGVGWFGPGVGFSADSKADQVPSWTMIAFIPDPAAHGGARQLRADIGDIRLDVGGTFSEVLTPAAYVTRYPSAGQ